MHNSSSHALSQPQIDLRPELLAKVLQIVEQYVPDKTIWAFGSRATFTAKPASDLDLCIVGDESVNFRALGNLQDAFSESDLPMKVDIVDYVTTSETFRKIIEEQKVILHTA
jgi:type I restriction enzyme S subunit